ncbi:hypothetical protein LTR56_020964 [Elasticomyces elasticus]|nr:hypothetical protein LTR56_020964 [Elasticomyces elasticus]KAK3646047.1 hypothetical protein LTR22_014482 [Elasticomyces elasticus]KAK4909795.1 hypothetical protein LTR49_021464 [Elasticomyces elasticus]KAK5761771.1 hypothetical protein LTS12_008026 [Elasticomyces elasticus]
MEKMSKQHETAVTRLREAQNQELERLREAFAIQSQEAERSRVETANRVESQLEALNRKHEDAIHELRHHKDSELERLREQLETNLQRERWQLKGFKQLNDDLQQLLHAAQREKRALSTRASISLKRVWEVRCTPMSLSNLLLIRTLTGLQAFRESYIPTITLSSPNIKPHQVEYVVQSHWHLLPAAVQGDWERKAYERFQIWEGQCIEHSRSVALSSRLGKLLSAYFTALLDCEPFDMVHDTSDALLAKIWSLGAPELDNHQLGHRPDTQQAGHEESMAPAPVTNVASFWAKFEQETE